MTAPVVLCRHCGGEHLIEAISTPIPNYLCGSERRELEVGDTVVVDESDAEALS